MRKSQTPLLASPLAPLVSRGRFAPAVKLAADTSAASAAAIGIKRGGDTAKAAGFIDVGSLAASMVGVLERHPERTRLGVVMKALQVRGQVYQYLVDHAEGATADEIAYALTYSVLTVRPRVSELHHMNKIVDSGLRRPNASGRKAIVWRAVE